MTLVRLSPHFSGEELTYSQTSARAGLSNKPSPAEWDNLRRLAGVLEQVRELLGHVPVIVTSGYRSSELNRLVGGSPGSAHMLGLAADFIAPAFGTPHEICNALLPYLDLLEIDQLIWEYGDWVHLGLSPDPERARRMCLTIDSSGTRVGFA